MGVCVSKKQFLEMTAAHNQAFETQATATEKIKEMAAAQQAQITELKSIMTILAAEGVMALNGRTQPLFHAKIFMPGYVQMEEQRSPANRQKIAVRAIELDIEEPDAAILRRRLFEEGVAVGSQIGGPEGYKINLEEEMVQPKFARSSTTMEERRRRAEPILKRERHNLAVLEATEQNLAALNRFLQGNRTG
jgi:hypothetical protein